MIGAKFFRALTDRLFAPRCAGAGVALSENALALSCAGAQAVSRARRGELRPDGRVVLEGAGTVACFDQPRVDRPVPVAVSWFLPEGRLNPGDLLLCEPPRRGQAWRLIARRHGRTVGVALLVPEEERA
jgi:hypothetical protein